jgi:hypothetical protein
MPSRVLFTQTFTSINVFCNKQIGWKKGRFPAHLHSLVVAISQKSQNLELPFEPIVKDIHRARR